jgi:hypothetical protein
VVAIQEPFLYNGYPLWVPNYLLLSPPVSPNYKIFTCFYIHSSFASSISFVPLFFDRGDFCGISITFSQASFNHHLSSLFLYNTYNRQCLWHTRSVPPTTAFTKSHHPSMVVGDLNIHNPISDLDRTFSANELALSNPYFLTALHCDYTLLNDPGSFTRHSNAQTQCPSIIDLCFTNSKLLPFIKH